MDARERYDDIVDALTAWHPHVRAGKVFGMPCLKRGGRVICGLSRTGMVFKLTDAEARSRALAVPGAHLFDPSGRGEAFRQWVVVPPEQAGSGSRSPRRASSKTTPSPHREVVPLVLACEDVCRPEAVCDGREARAEISFAQTRRRRFVGEPCGSPTFTPSA